MTHTAWARRSASRPQERPGSPEKAAAARLVHGPYGPDPELDVIRRRGFEQEQRCLADLEAAGRHATRIEFDGSVEETAHVEPKVFLGIPM
jgi:hypothetical protein